MGHIHDLSSSSYYNKQAFENVDYSSTLVQISNEFVRIH